jgi:hypothetical protein
VLAIRIHDTKILDGMKADHYQIPFPEKNALMTPLLILFPQDCWPSDSQQCGSAQCNVKHRLDKKRILSTESAAMSGNASKANWMCSQW